MMESDRDREKHRRRVRLVKRLLRHMPRRGNLHRYPILRCFERQARQRGYLWSFRVREVVPALYVGWILTLTPILSLHIFVACLLSFIFRANIMIVVLLQFVSMPWTVPILWYADYKVGAFFVEVLGTPQVEAIRRSYAQVSFKGIGDLFIHGDQWVRWFFTTTLGAIILGMFLGHISAAIYRYLAKRS
ncbi:MAG: DUF2062 domain-containing protein [Puniceicoccales bacterium]|jgi:uncharacterized protein (DUF2062 family)|nr:DUF2062 domain-containing protein [Puniceicoccales bacterium]